MNKLLKFTKDKREYFIASGIVTAIFLLYLIIGGMWPFGTKTLAHYDGYYQVVPFAGQMFDFLNGNSTFTYSNLIAGGANIVGVLLYFFLNPFLPVFFLFGQGNMYYAINLVYLLYFISISISFLYFLRKKFSTINTTSKIVLSCLYAFSAYALCNHTLTVWLNFLIILPLLWIYFEKLIYENKIIGFSIFTALLIYTSYAVGSFLQIILILIYTLYIILIVKKENRKKSSLNLLCGLFCGLLLSLIIIIPALLQLKNSCRIAIESNSSEISYDFNSTSTNVFFYMLQSISVIITIWGLLKTYKQNKLNKFLLLSLLLCSLPMLFDDITKFISGGYYICYCTRYFSINSFLIFISLSQVFSDNSNQSIEIINNKKEKIPLFLNLLSILFSILLIISTLKIFLTLGPKMAIGEMSFNELLSYILLLPLIFISFFFICFNLKRSKLITKKVFNCFIIIIICVEGFISGLCTISTGALETTTARMYYELTSTLSPYTRVKTSEGLIGSNSNLISSVSTFSIFSSCAENSTFQLSKYLGYKPTIPNVSNTNGTYFSDLMLGYEYMFTSRDFDHRSYLTKVDSKNGYNLYKYNYTFPRAFILDNINQTVDNKRSLLEMQNQLSSILNGSDNLMQKLNNFTMMESEYEKAPEGSNCYSITITAPISGILYFNNLAENKKIIIHNANDEKCDGDTVIDVEELNTTQTYSFNLFVPDNETYSEDEFELVMIDTNAVKNISEALNNVSVDITYTKDGYILNTSNINNRNILIIQSNPLGMQYTSNNGASNIKISTQIYGLTYIESVNNEIVTAKFNYPHTTIVLILGIGGILLSVILLVLFTKKRQCFDFLEKPAIILNYIIVCGIAIYFYILPSFISIVTIISIIF